MRDHRHALAINGRDGQIGSGAAVGPGLVLTALHVVDPEAVGDLYTRDHTGTRFEITGTATLPLRRYGPDRPGATASARRHRELTGDDLGTVDLALLGVPGLRAAPLPVRAGPVRRGERVVVAAYPNTHRTLTAGPVTSHDPGDFIAHLLLGPGASGAAALDTVGRLTGVVTHDDAGTIRIGPALITTFLRHTGRLLARLPVRAVRRAATAGRGP